MPRDLTDLMEAAVSAAPPEIHHAADITQLAARRQRRRTAYLAGAAAAAVLVVAGVTVGLSQSHPSRPEPASGYRHDQVVSLKSAAPASSLRGFQVVPWMIPSLQTLGGNTGGTYQAVDADGRLIVQRYAKTGGLVSSLRPRLYAAPGQPASTLRSPAPGPWALSFVSGGRLFWHPDSGTTQGIGIPSKGSSYVTDLSGGGAVPVRTSDISLSANSSADANDPMISGDRYWFTTYDHNLPGLQGAAEDLYVADFGGTVTKVASDVLTAAVGDDTVAWVTTGGQVMTQSTTGGNPQAVPVSYPSGCQLPPGSELQGASGNALAVDRSTLALTIACGTGKGHSQGLLAVDRSGRPLVQVEGDLALSPSLGEGAVVFTGVGPSGKVATYRYDLRTGSLVQVGGGVSQQRLPSAQAAGDYVLWYDGSGGHVGHFGG